MIQGNVPMALTYRSVDQTATLTIATQTLPPNGHYYCLADSRYYNLNWFLHSNNSIHAVSIATPTVSARNTSMWTLTSPDGSRVERYIVEFECRVRNITFVEKYMSVSASGGTGRVATSVSCFGGLGQLYRVKVWAVSGPNISRQPAVKLVNTGTVSTLCSYLLCTVCNDNNTNVHLYSRWIHTDNPSADIYTNHWW